MNKHLKLISEFHDTRSMKISALESRSHFSDMDIVKYQAMLMKAGSDVLQAIKAGEMVEILLGLVNLAYVAVEAIAARKGEICDLPVAWRHDGSVITLMRTLSDKISQCSSGKAEDYSAIYCLCVHLTRSFINADFDKAFQILHESYRSTSTNSNHGVFADEGGMLTFKAPDLSDCLYE